MRQFVFESSPREETRRLLGGVLAAIVVAAVEGVPCRSRSDKDHCRSNTACGSGDTTRPRPLRVLASPRLSSPLRTNSTAARAGPLVTPSEVCRGLDSRNLAPEFGRLGGVVLDREPGLLKLGLGRLARSGGRKQATAGGGADSGTERGEHDGTCAGSKVVRGWMMGTSHGGGGLRVTRRGSVITLCIPSQYNHSKFGRLPIQTLVQDNSTFYSPSLYSCTTAHPHPRSRHCRLFPPETDSAPPSSGHSPVFLNVPVSGTKRVWEASRGDRLPVPSAAKSGGSRARPPPRSVPQKLLQGRARLTSQYPRRLGWQADEQSSRQSHVGPVGGNEDSQTPFCRYFCNRILRHRPLASPATRSHRPTCRSSSSHLRPRKN